MKFFLRIGQDGRVKYSYSRRVRSATPTLKIAFCKFSRKQPKPEGGEAEVRKSFGFDAPGDVRAPTSWPSDKIVTALGKAEDDVKKCRRGVSGSFKVTAYVEPDGKHGKVQAKQASSRPAKKAPTRSTASSRRCTR
ncbi:MAG: hypothetical protein U0235_25325 [Polyangiaceae bacterium]